MKKLLPAGFCLLLGLSLLAGCGGGGSAIQNVVHQTSASPCPSPMSSSALSLVCPPPGPLPGNVGQYFYVNDLGIYVQGGQGPLTLTFKSGTLPSGLTWVAGPNAGIFGIPTAVAASTAVITVTDSENPPMSVNASVLITINPMLSLGISPASGALPAGTVGALYNRICGRGGCGSGVWITALGGVMPYHELSWSALPGSSLPSGLSLNGRLNCADPRGCSGLISGTPTTAGTYNFVVTATDSESPPQQASANYTIAVAP